MVCLDIWLAQIAREEKDFKGQKTWWEEDAWRNDKVDKRQNEMKRTYRYQTCYIEEYTTLNITTVLLLLLIVLLNIV